jgi:hypothetical protein
MLGDEKVALRTAATTLPGVLLPPVVLEGLHLVGDRVLLMQTKVRDSLGGGQRKTTIERWRPRDESRDARRLRPGARESATRPNDATRRKPRQTLHRARCTHRTLAEVGAATRAT